MRLADGSPFPDEKLYSQGLIRPCKRDIKDVMDSTRQYFAAIRNRSTDDLDFCT
jgi:hypothetical protein